VTSLVFWPSLAKARTVRLVVWVVWVRVWVAWVREVLAVWAVWVREVWVREVLVVSARVLVVLVVLQVVTSAESWPSSEKAKTAPPLVVTHTVLKELQKTVWKLITPY
jgi:hypothetical protein